MLISNETVSEESNTYQVEDELIKNISKVKLGAVTDVSDQFVMLNIKVVRFLIYLLQVPLSILMILKQKKDQLFKQFYLILM